MDYVTMSHLVEHRSIRKHQGYYTQHSGCGGEDSGTEVKDLGVLVYHISHLAGLGFKTLTICFSEVF